MRQRLSLMVAVCLFFAATAVAQTIVEKETKILFNEKSANVSLVVESDKKSFDGTILLELIDADDKVRGRVETNARIEKGRTTHLLALPFGELSADDKQNIAWFRLRYKVGETRGIVSVSEILRDAFELRVVTSPAPVSGGMYRTRVRAIVPETETGVGDVDVTAQIEIELRGDEDRALTLKSTARTDTDGFAVIDFSIPDDAELSDSGELKVRGFKNGISREAEKDLDVPTDRQSFLMLADKPIYQPGQALSARGILFKGIDGKTVVAGSEVEFIVRFEDDSVLFKEKVRTSDFGIASMSWTIPDNAKLGDYWVVVKAANSDDDREVGRQKVRISRYDLPNFTLQARALKPYYLPSETEAEVEVSAAYLFGKPVTNGKVRVVREDEREWNWREQKWNIDEGEAHEGQTNKNGIFTAKFNLASEFAALSRWDRFVDLHLTAYYTDLTTNRTEQRRFDVRITREPIHVYFIGRRYNNNPRLPISGHISTFYADGSPAQCDVVVKGREEYYNRDFIELKRIKTNKFGVGKLEFTRPKLDDDDDLEYQLFARDRNGRSGTDGVFDDGEELRFDEGDQLKITTSKTIHKPGEAIQITLASTIKTGVVYLDLVDGWTTVDSRFAVLSNGRASVTIPYKPTFKGAMTLSAFVEGSGNGNVSAARGVIYPTHENLKIDAKFDKESYKPGDDAKIDFNIVDADGRETETALGISIIDRAVEERARTDSEFGGTWRDYNGWLGYDDNFGQVSLKDINELDLTQPIDKDLDLVAEAMFSDRSYWPNITRSRSYFTDASSVYAARFLAQFGEFEKTLLSHFQKTDGDHPADIESFQRILRQNSVDFDAFRDPWDRTYRAEFSIDRASGIVRILTSGADKTVGTRDDFTVSTVTFAYFTKTGKLIDDAVVRFHRETGGFILNQRTLLDELEMTEIRDAYGRPYQFKFDVSGRKLEIRVISAGKDGVFCNCTWRDDFDVWLNSIDYFAETEKKIGAALEAAEKYPMTEDELKKVLSNDGIDFDSLRDGYGEQLYLVKTVGSRYADRVVKEKIQLPGEATPRERTVIKPVTQETIRFSIYSGGRDRRKGSFDDTEFASFTHVISERTKDDETSKPVVMNQPVAYRGGTGSISGSVTDTNEAGIPSATITVSNVTTGSQNTAVTSDSGTFMITSLIAGTYTVKAEKSGFKSSITSGVKVTADSVENVKIKLEIGDVSATVDVTSDAAMIETSSSSISTESKKPKSPPKNASPADKSDFDAGQQKSTPRLREYFPETLFWAPEIVTDKNGKATVNFKFADNITTWKLFTVASTKNGKIGVAEKEVQAFQPFFVDLDPPKFLTDGDEIFLPTQVRNYTPTKQKVGVTMSKSDWFSFIGPDVRDVEVATNASANAVFGFKAITPVKNGKQRVTAVAKDDSDAIEKPVTVRPNGFEVVRTDSKLFTGRESFGLDFPSNALAKTTSAEFKIYPNLMAHVSEAVDGLLMRPYGCGEQTISSTYPNLMILKFDAGNAEIKKKARKFLQKGYEKLLGYQLEDGGFSYWGAKDSSDVALTAYALRFLTDAAKFVEVDPKVIKNATAFLVKKQREDGAYERRYSWENADDTRRTKLQTSYVARTLAMVKSTGAASGEFDAALAKSLDFLRARNSELDEPYTLALYALASFDAGRTADAEEAVGQLQVLGKTENGGMYWNLETNTPFYGWGTAGRVETTALVLQSLLRSKKQTPQTVDQISKATIFLLKSKDRYGVWYSTQTTINVLDAFLASLSPARAQKITITSGGEKLREFDVPADQITPLVVDLGSARGTTVEIAGANDSRLMAQVVRGHYIDWKDAEISRRNVNESRAVEMDYSCDKLAPKIMETVTCNVAAERVGFKGYGMLLAEIGIPPGAEVSRESLEKALASDWALSRYEVLPDRIVFYMWAKAGGTKFDFTFKPRYAVKAKTPASFVYDYYNEEARAVVAPLMFEVR